MSQEQAVACERHQPLARRFRAGIVLAAAVALTGCTHKVKSATGEQPAPADGTKLQIDLTNVAWTKLSQEGNSSTWRKTGSHVLLSCQPPTVAIKDEAASSREGLPDAAALCAAIRSDAPLLTKETALDPACESNSYWPASVSVRGKIAGAAIHQQFQSCKPLNTNIAANTAQRWMILLGMSPVGPDVPG